MDRHNDGVLDYSQLSSTHTIHHLLTTRSAVGIATRTERSNMPWDCLLTAPTGDSSSTWWCALPASPTSTSPDSPSDSSTSPPGAQLQHPSPHSRGEACTYKGVRELCRKLWDGRVCIYGSDDAIYAYN